MLTGLVLALFSCGGQTSDAILTALPTPATDTTLQTLVITKVKTPWYAWRSLVAGKMEKTISEYQKINGLQEKYYAFTQSHAKFGGLYFWKQKEDAEKWFNTSWYERVEKQFGEKGIVEYYTIERITQIATIPAKAKNLYAVVSYTDIKDLASLRQSEGLVKYALLQDTNQKKCLLTLWKDEKAALKNFPESAENQYFDVPLFIVNPK